VGSSGRATMCNGSGAWKGGTNQLTTYRIEPNSGTIASGIILFYGVQ